jgi:transposase
MNTTQPHLVCIETVADLPVIWASLQQLEFVRSCDRLFPPPTSWKGPLTVGEVLAVWLLFILSQQDHCLNHVEPWIADHCHTLSALLGKPVTPKAWHDDRLADLLTRLSFSSSWEALERDLNRQTIRLYSLPTDTVRIDTTTANSYSQVLSEKGLLQFGHSKDDPTRPQIKIATAILDPLGMPLVTTVVPGNTADDPLYIPAIQAVQQALEGHQRTVVGDCKMAAAATRAYVAATDDYYLCPLSEKQLDREQRRELLQPVWAGRQALQAVWRPAPEGEAEELVAEGFLVAVKLTEEVDNRTLTWTEHRWVVRSAAYAAAQQVALERRLAKAVAALQDLPRPRQGKKRLSEEELHVAAEAIVAETGVTGLLTYSLQQETTTRQVRAYKGQPTHLATETTWVLQAHRQEEAITACVREMGWQVYATNHTKLSLPQVVWAYRGQYRIEDDWSRLKGQPLGLTPMYLQDEGRIQGLVHLLSLGLRVLTLLEWVVRDCLRKEGRKLEGLYAGQPGRKTDRPSAELLWRALQSLSVTVVEVAGVIHVLLTPLKAIHRRLLELWGLPSDLYETVAQKIEMAFRFPSDEQPMLASWAECLLVTVP